MFRFGNSLCESSLTVINMAKLSQSIKVLS